MGVASPLVHALGDSDAIVRADAAISLGNIGPSAAFAVQDLLKRMKDEESVRASALAALGKIRERAEDSLPAAAESIKNGSPLVRLAAIRTIGQLNASPQQTIPLLISAMKASTREERVAVSEALADIAVAAQDGDKRDALELLIEAQRIVPPGGGTANSQRLINRSVKYLSLLPNGSDSPAGAYQKVSLADGTPQDFIGLTSLEINGDQITLAQPVERGANLYFLGEPLSRGLNWIQSRRGALRKAVAYWYEERRLKLFRVPYGTSYAILVAIDDYGNSTNKSHPKSTGFTSLGSMVQGAREISAALQDLGFPKENIIELYDANATSDQITKTLQQFWQGPNKIRADMLFFYFGGHGVTNASSPCLVTSDFDPEQPTLSGLLMGDVVGRHFDNVTARHLFVAIDACYAGLAIPQYRFLDEAAAEKKKRLQEFRTLSIVEVETWDTKARNILIAGTDGQRAVWEDGGVFTKALVKGLRGQADINNDGIIQFEELTFFVKDEVLFEAGQGGSKQVPRYWRKEGAGYGNVVFLRGKRKP